MKKKEINNSYFHIYPIIFLLNGKSINYLFVINSKSFPIANVYKSLNLLADILSRALVLMSFILLKVRSVVVGETGMIIARMRRDIIVRNAWRDAESSKYKQIMSFDSDSFSRGFNTCISFDNNRISHFNKTQHLNRPILAPLKCWIIW